MRCAMHRIFTARSLSLLSILSYFSAISVLGSTDRASAESKKRTVHLVLSNHLDIGFDGISPLIGTDDNVVNVYFDLYFPKAIAVDDILRRAGGKPRLKYLTHSWLVSLYLDCPPGIGFHCPSKFLKEAVEGAIRDGVIYWHAFPFNGQLEFMDEELIRQSIRMTHDLDARFGYLPKMTLSQRDVPGFTRGALPILESEGVRAFTVGVNGGSAPPGVPKNTPFWWRDEGSGKQLLGVLHPGGYSGDPVDGKGECIELEGFDDILCMSWKQDNWGPHDVNEVISVFNATQRNFPDAHVRVSTLDAFFERLLAAAPDLDLPVLTGEIGDSWIYGVASDALKVAEYREVLRMRREIQARDPGAFQFMRQLGSGMSPYANFSRILSKVGEHTWGLDVKTFLGDYVNWGNGPFHALVDQGAWNYRRMVDAWKRQRAYVGWALDALAGTPEGLEMRNGLEALRAGHSAPDLAAQGLQPLGPGANLTFSSGAWTISLDPGTGALAGLQRQYADRAGVQWAGEGAPLGAFAYSSYTEEDYGTIWDEYLYISRDNWWVGMDFGKLNCSNARPRRADVAAAMRQAWARQDDGGFHVVVRSTLPEWAVADAGAPAEVWLDMRSGSGSEELAYDVIWVNKTATRLPEASWVSFAPRAADAATWRMSKLGSPVGPLEVIYNGSFSQHAVGDEGVAVKAAGVASWEALNIRSLDAALVSPGKPTPFPNVRHAPDLAHGMAFNLANNIWGTNYVMWQPYVPEGETMRFRFRVGAGPVQGMRMQAGGSWWQQAGGSGGLERRRQGEPSVAVS